MERNSRKLIEMLERDGWSGYGCLDLPAGWLEIASGSMQYVAFIHSDDANYGISFPDFPGCISVGATKEDAVRQGAEALSFHIEGLVEDGLPIPRPRSVSDIETDPGLTEWRQGAALTLVHVEPNHATTVASRAAS